jgi:hypothetical protein
MVTQARTVHGLPPQSDMETPNRAGLEQRVADALSVAGSISPSDIVGGRHRWYTLFTRCCLQPC